MTAVFYDHALNQGNAAVAVAMARTAKESREAGTAYRIEFTVTRTGQRLFYTGGRYDVLGLAKDVDFNPGYADVILTNPAGQQIDIKSAKY